MKPKFKIGETVKLNKDRIKNMSCYNWSKTGTIEDIKELSDINLIQYFISDGMDNIWFYENELERIK